MHVYVSRLGRLYAEAGMPPFHKPLYMARAIFTPLFTFIGKFTGIYEQRKYRA